MATRMRASSWASRRAQRPPERELSSQSCSIVFRSMIESRAGVKAFHTDHTSLASELVSGADVYDCALLIYPLHMMILLVDM
jgi:hypothetical protein